MRQCPETVTNFTDKQYKIRPLYDLLRRTWKDMYNLNEHVAIDEGILMWRAGCHSGLTIKTSA